MNNGGSGYVRTGLMQEVKRPTQSEKRAAANLSQLRFFSDVTWEGVSMELPLGIVERRDIRRSLEALGLDMNGSTDFNNLDGKSPFNYIVALDIDQQKCSHESIVFSESGVEKLLRSGVKNPVLDVLREEKNIPLPASIDRSGRGGNWAGGV